MCDRLLNQQEVIKLTGLSNYIVRKITEIANLGFREGGEILYDKFDVENLTIFAEYRKNNKYIPMMYQYIKDNPECTNIELKKYMRKQGMPTKKFDSVLADLTNLCPLAMYEDIEVKFYTNGKKAFRTVEYLWIEGEFFSDAYIKFLLGEYDEELSEL
jgi:hypothetical protein